MVLFWNLSSHYKVTGEQKIKHFWKRILYTLKKSSHKTEILKQKVAMFFQKNNAYFYFYPSLLGQEGEQKTKKQQKRSHFFCDLF